MTADKPTIDWDAIEEDFRSGSMPVREMARWYQVPESTLRKRIKSGGWVRNGARPEEPAHQVEAAPATTIQRTLLSSETADPKAIVARGRNLVLRLLDELEATTTHRAELEEMILVETANDQSPRRREALMKAVQLPSRAKVLASLMLAARTAADVSVVRGKKEQAAEASETAGQGTEWGDDLIGPTAH